MSWWSASSEIGPGIGTLREDLEEDRFILDLSRAETLAALRGDVRRIARSMDQGGDAPPMMWTGIPFPARARDLGTSSFCLVVSVGGTKTDFALLRLESGEVRILDRHGVEHGGAEIAQVKRSLRIPTPTQAELKSGIEMIEKLSGAIAGYLAPNAARLGNRLEIILSWGFANKVVRTGDRVLGGVAALTTLMTKEQAAFTTDLKGKDIGRLLGSALERRLGWNCTVTAANDGIMALHYFLRAEYLKAHERIGLFINGTGTNFAMAERYAVRSAGVVSRPGEEYQPRRLTRGQNPAAGEHEELYLVNYETGSIPLAATLTVYDDPSHDYPIEANALSGGNAFEQQLRGVVRARISSELYAELVESRRTIDQEHPAPRGPEVARLAVEGPGAIDALFPGVQLAEVDRERLVFVARAIVRRSALHAALILAAVTERNRFGLGGEARKPDLLAMEGSVWSTEGYPDLVRAAWQALVGVEPLRVDFGSEESYNASQSGPLYFAVIHG